MSYKNILVLFSISVNFTFQFFTNKTSGTSVVLFYIIRATGDSNDLSFKLNCISKVGNREKVYYSYVILLTKPHDYQVISLNF